jgi:hypothetical protein
MKGKFVSLSVEAQVLSSEARAMACSTVKADGRVKMAF